MFTSKASYTKKKPPKFNYCHLYEIPKLTLMDIDPVRDEPECRIWKSMILRLNVKYFFYYRRLKHDIPVFN